jgi:hypothetical protein
MIQQACANAAERIIALLALSDGAIAKAGESI